MGGGEGGLESGVEETIEGGVEWGLESGWSGVEWRVESGELRTSRVENGVESSLGNWQVERGVWRLETGEKSGVESGEVESGE